MPITASSGQQAATPIRVGNKQLALVNGGQPANVLSTAPAAGNIIPINSSRLAISLVPVGSLSDDATVTLLGEINGSSYFPMYYPNTKTLIQWTGAEIKQALSGASAGLLATIEGIKVNSIKFLLAIGSTTVSASNGVNTRVLD